MIWPSARSGRRTEIDDAGCRKLCLQHGIAVGNAMVALVEQDQVEKIRRQRLEPAVFFSALELADVGDYDLRFLEIGAVCRGASNFDGFGIGPASEHPAFW